ncbi:MAG: quinoprotein relay system zinc metallohydrolase 2 [Pseudomonadota bacterium]
MFELLAMICIEGLCKERLLPASTPQTQAECEADAGRAEDWAAARGGASVQSTRCAALEELVAGAINVAEIAPGAFVHEGLVAETVPANRGDVSNNGFIIGANSVAVIDTGYTRALAEALYLAVRAETNKPISHLILTHMHPDHAMGGDVFLEAGAEAVGAPKFQRAYETRLAGYIDAQVRLIGAEASHGTYGLLTARVTEGEVIDIGERPLTLQVHPTAHTTNDLTIFDKTAATLWMGDLTFLHHTPALDGSITGWIDLLEHLNADKARQIVPGHGPAVAAYPDGTKPTLDYLTALASAMRGHISRGESLQFALKDEGKAMKGEWELFEHFHRRNATFWR